MNKLMIAVTLLSVSCFSGGFIVQADDLTSTNSVTIELAGWDTPEAKPPTNPCPPTGQEVIIPPVIEEGTSQPNDKLPQTGEQATSQFVILGINFVIIATLALIDKRKQFKGDF